MQLILVLGAVALLLWKPGLTLAGLIIFSMLMTDPEPSRKKPLFLRFFSKFSSQNKEEIESTPSEKVKNDKTQSLSKLG